MEQTYSRHSALVAEIHHANRVRQFKKVYYPLMRYVRRISLTAIFIAVAMSVATTLYLVASAWFVN